MDIRVWIDTCHPFTKACYHLIPCFLSIYMGAVEYVACVFHQCIASVAVTLFQKLQMLDCLAYNAMSTHLFSYPEVEQVKSCSHGLPDIVSQSMSSKAIGISFSFMTMELETAVVNEFCHLELKVGSNFL
jgi:hypothetical protein